MWEATRGLSHRTTKVQTITLDRLLTAEKVERLDFLTMDIETYEPQALAGFDIERYRPSLVCPPISP
jgi:FkbM family methyltransferase